MMDINLECFVMESPLKHIPRFRRFSLPSRLTVSWPDDQKDKKDVSSWTKPESKQEQSDETLINIEDKGHLEQRNRSHSESPRDISFFHWGKHNKDKRSVSVNEEDISQVLKDENQHDERPQRRERISTRKSKNSKEKSPIRDEFLHEISSWFKKINTKESKDISNAEHNDILEEELEESPVVSEVKLSLNDKPLNDEMKLEENEEENEKCYDLIRENPEENSEVSPESKKPAELEREITEEDNLDDVHKNHSKKYNGISPTEQHENSLWHRVHNSQNPEQKESLWHRRQNVFHSIRKRLTSLSSEVSDSSRDSTGSTGNFSAPVVSIGAPAPPAPRSAPASPLQPPVVPAPSPHHDKSGKQASWSGGEAGPGAPEAGGGAGPLPAPAPSSHKARQKKFHRHFPQASQEERVLNYYSCALVGDILLQGHLYITKNYFAFYSNVFGYVTKLLIPLSSVVRVSKEKMARIIPNAVGITTLEDKHVFASLLSRDTTYKLMMQVLKASPAPVIELSPSPQELRLTKGESEVSLDEDSSCCSQSGAEEGGRVAPVLSVAALPIAGLAAPHVRDRSRLRTPDIDTPVAGLVGVSTDFTRKPSIPVLLAGARATGRRRGLSATPLSPPMAPSPPPSAHSLLLLAATALLVVLFLSAGLLLYRIGKVGAPDGHIDDNVLMLKRGDDVYSQILKWHSQLHTKSAMQVHDFLHSNLDQIAKVRQSLETLSTLIGGIITDKMAPLDTRQGGYITRQGEPSSGESLRGNANS